MIKPGSDSTQHITLLGGFGFMGSRLCKKLVDAGHRVRIFDLPNASTTRVADVMDRIEWVRGDHGNVREVMDALKGSTTVIHLIHTTVPGSSMRDPAYDVQSNVAASAAWLSRIGETSVKRVIYFSSGGTVYGRARKLPIRETHELEPVSSYGISKLACEKFVAMYCDLAGISHTILRPSNAYGEHQPADRGQGILGVYVDRVLRGQPLEVWGEGTSVRDYIHVDDIAEAVLALLRYDGDQNIFNVSTGAGHSVSDIIALLNSATGRKHQTIRLSDRGYDVRDNVLDNSALRSETKWSPSISLEEGLQRMLRAEGVEVR